ncbi:ATP-binding cassette domain-containing protein [Desulfobaculum bizertense]|uniref:ABC transporter ATP-binding protein n=1 Tax=Desulfobaculum bizertense TaxID=376490 RepID=UPI001F327987|nr:oligopeptide/dipeptide ABC transporter ATP-binding protein [Desulfobaculum bizertense]UIJ37432.1 ATP-binding cassette domain-containing protein [Desulfobaculum bizertense]
MSSSPYLQIRDLTRTYEMSSGLLGLNRSAVHALNGISLDIMRGETLGLVGESGCGKSTLARLLMRLEAPSSGNIYLEGQSLWSQDPRFIDALPHKIQMIFQDPFSSLNPRRRVQSTIAEALTVQGMPRAERAERVQKLLALVGLRPEHATRYPHEFSGGQRQRIAIARALAPRPACIICDEAVSALDVSIQAQVINLLRDLQERLGLTYVFISHDLAVIRAMSTRIAVMYFGQLMELSPAQELYDRPLHPYTQALLKAIPIPDPKANRFALHLGGELPSPFLLPSGCPFHPRCPKALPICKEEHPGWKEISLGHSVSCHLY